jgi:hypothetical protein
MASIRRILGILKNSTVEVGKLRTVEETFVVARQTTDVNLPADTLVTIPFNQEDEDRLDEFDPSTGTFTPQEGGWHEFLVHVEFAVNSDNDELKLEILDVNAGDSIFESEIRANGTGNRDRSMNAVVDLEAGEEYRVQAENSDNNDTVNGKPKRTRLIITPELSGRDS